MYQLLKNKLPIVDKGDVLVNGAVVLTLWYKVSELKEQEWFEKLGALPHIPFNPDTYDENDYETDYNTLDGRSERAICAIFPQFQALAKEFNQQLTYTINPQTFRWKALAETRQPTPEIWLSQQEQGRPYSINYHNGARPDDAPDCYFIAHTPYHNKNNLAYLTIGFPLTILENEQQTQRYLEHVEQWVKLLAPLHGTVALNLTRNHYRAREAQPYEYLLTQAITGLDFNYHQQLAHFLPPLKMKGVQWLTIASRRLLRSAHREELNTIESLCPDVQVTSLPDNLIFQLSPLPQLVYPDASYAQLTHYLSPLIDTRLPTPHGDPLRSHQADTYHDDMSYQAWLNRFNTEQGR